MSDQEAREMTRDELILLNNVLREERDRAREECGHEKHMRQFNAEERDRWIKKWTEHEKTCGSAGTEAEKCVCGHERVFHRPRCNCRASLHSYCPCSGFTSAVGPGDDETGTAVEGLGESLAGIAGANDRAHRPSGLGQSVVPNEGDVRTRDPHDLPSVSSAPDAAAEYPTMRCLVAEPHPPHVAGPPIRGRCPGAPLDAAGRWHNHTDDGIHTGCPGCREWPCAFHDAPTPGCEMCRNEGGSGARLSMAAPDVPVAKPCKCGDSTRQAVFVHNHERCWAAPLDTVKDEVREQVLSRSSAPSDAATYALMQIGAQAAVILDRESPGSEAYIFAKYAMSYVEAATSQGVDSDA